MEENTQMEEVNYELEPKFPEAMDLLYPGDEALEMDLDYFEDEKQEDKLWMARTGLDMDTLCGSIETVIFMSDKPVSLAKIRKVIDEDMPLRVIHESIERLQEEYEQKQHGLRLVEVAEGYQYRTKATYSKYVQDLFKVNSLVLSPTALEVLAIIAYKQPAAKTEVDKIRGVDSGHIVRGLMDKRLVKVMGRSDDVGRPVLYGTTPEFMEVFNLPDLTHLPPETELEAILDQGGGVGKISDIKTIVHTGDKERFKFDEIDELDQLGNEIKNISADTNFTKELKVVDKNRKKEDGEKALTAFEVLELFVNNQAIEKTNIEAGASEPFTAITFADVVSDLTSGPFNVPEQEDENFEMIDLDTGLPIPEEEELEIEVELSEDDNETEETVNLLGSDLIDSRKSEEEELATALDEAFAKLTGESLDDKLEAQEISDDELSLNEADVTAKSNEIDELSENIIEKANDLDIDLSFLREGSDTKITDEDTDIDA